MKKKTNTEESVKKYVEKLKEKQEAEKQIISNYEYISWLENFTQTHTTFASDFWLYKKEELPEDDYAKVEKLFLFFNAISNYCHKFHINIECHENFERENVHITHNNVGYEFGLVVGQGAFVYVHRETPQDNAISFDNIMNSIVPEDFKTKEELLKKFEEILSSMEEADVPSEVVRTTMQKYYK